MTLAARDHLLAVAHCPVVAEVLQDQAPGHQCERVVLSQWDGRTPEERLAHWQRFHQLPTPWVGVLETAPLLFVSSNPRLGGTLLPDLDTAPSKTHWTTFETEDDEVVERFEGTFARHRADAQLARAASAQRYWSSIRQRAQELFDEPVVPGDHYALTEVARCPSVTETLGDVASAARFCVPMWLRKTLELSGARVIVGVGEHARRGLPKVLPELNADGGVQQVTLGERQVLVTFLPGPGAPKKKKFATTHTDDELTRLRSALGAAARL